MVMLFSTFRTELKDGDSGGEAEAAGGDAGEDSDSDFDLPEPVFAQ